MFKIKSFLIYQKKVWTLIYWRAFFCVADFIVVFYFLYLKIIKDNREKTYNIHENVQFHNWQ